MIGVVIAEQVERHLGEHRRVATIATDHGEGAAADSGAGQRLRELDLATVRSITQPDGARALVAFCGRWTGVDDESAIAGNGRVGAGLGFHGNGRCLCQTGR